MIRLCTAHLPRSIGEPIGIVGGGNSAHALSAYLAERGFSPHIYVRDPTKLTELARSQLLRSTGAIDGLFAVPLVTGAADVLSRRCRTIFICTVATAYPDVARQLAPYLTSAHEIVVFSSKLFGSLELARALAQHGAVQPELIVETDALFAARVQTDGSVWVRGIKGWNLAATPQADDIARGAALVQRFFPQVEPATNLVHRGLTDFGALVHPLTMLANVNRIDRGEPFLFYMDGFTPRSAALIETLETELGTVAHAYGATLIPARELLNRYYGCDTSGTLLAAMRSVPNYRTSAAPTQLDHRYLREDVSCTLMPACELARKAQLETPVLDAIVAFARVLMGQELVDGSRTLARLGLADLPAATLRRCLTPGRADVREAPVPQYELVS